MKWANIACDLMVKVTLNRKQSAYSLRLDRANRFLCDLYLGKSVSRLSLESIWLYTTENRYISMHHQISNTMKKHNQLNHISHSSHFIFDRWASCNEKKKTTINWSVNQWVLSKMDFMNLLLYNSRWIAVKLMRCLITWSIKYHNWLRHSNRI